MKEALTSYLRHTLTALAALGAYALQFGLITPEQVGEVNDVGASILKVLVPILAALIMRAILFLLGKIFPKSGSKYYLPCVVVWSIGTALVVHGFLLTSCSSTPPIDVRIKTPDGGSIQFSHQVTDSK